MAWFPVETFREATVERADGGENTVLERRVQKLALKLSLSMLRNWLGAFPLIS